MRSPRALGVLLFLLGGGIGLLASTQTWFMVTLAGTGESIAVDGASALPVVTPLSLATLALAGVLALAGRVLRYILAALAAITAIALSTVIASLLLTRPISAVSAVVTETTGLAGADAIEAMISGVSTTGWPAFALVGWIVLLGGGVFVSLTASRWRRGGRRYQTAASHSGPVDAIDTWDDLSRGSDPTGSDR